MMSTTRGFAVNSLIAYIGSFAVIGLGVVSKVCLARLLSADDLGIFLTAQVLFGMLVFIAGLGMPDAIARFVGLYAKPDLPRAVAVLKTGLLLVVCSGVVLAIPIIIFAPALARYFIHDSRYSAIAIIIALAVPFKLAADLIGSANQGAGQLYLKTLWVDLLPAAVFASSLGLLLMFNRGSLNLLLSLYMLPFVLSGLFFVGQFRLFSILKNHEMPVPYRDMFRYSLPLLLSGIVGWPLTLVPVVIGRMTSAASVSYYSLAISLASFIYLGTSVAEAAGLSVWSSYIGAGETHRLKEDYRLSTRWGVLVGSVVFAPLFLCPHEVVVLLFGPHYQPVAHILPAVSCIFLANLVTGPTESLLKAHGDTRVILAARLAVGTVVLVTLYPFLKLWGLSGAVAVYGLCGGVGGIAIYSGYLYKHYRLHPFDGNYVAVLASVGSAILITGLILRTIPYSGGPLVTIAGAVIVYALLLLLHVIVLPGISHRDRYIFSRVRSRIYALFGMSKDGQQLSDASVAIR